MTNAPSPLHVSAPAKINLHLRVGPARTDGFHPLLTWMVTVGLADTLMLSASAGDGGITMTCDDPAIPCDDSNLIVKAATLLAAHGSEAAAVMIHLTKRIPAGGGLGGGSSDAAHAMLALGRLWQVDDVGRLATLAARVGSDVPFFLYGPSSVCRGRGEIVRPIAVPSVARWAVLVLPGIAVPTPDVYRQFDAMGLGGDVETEPDWSRWTALSAEALLAELANDLEAPAFALRPELGVLRLKLEQTLARPVRMSGSGSTLFTLYDDEAAATDAVTRGGATGVRALAVPVAPPAEIFV